MELSDFKGERASDFDPVRDDHSMDVHRLRQLVIKDDLTELYNRRYFKERLREEKRRGDLQGSPFSLLILDVDYFKEVNDNFGHVAGDKVLVQIARIIDESVREIDISCRYAGDEFVVILPGARENETERVVERIVNNLHSFLWGERIGIDLPKLTCSVGFTCYPDDARELSLLIKRADQALYWAKGRGRDCWVRWNPKYRVEPEDPAQTNRAQMLEMVGRVKERERMLQVIEGVKGGRGCSVIIEGEMGVGKTRLAQYAVMRLDRNEFRSLPVNCFKETAEIPYFPLRELSGHLVSSCGEELGRVLKEIGPQQLRELARFCPSMVEKGVIPNHAKDDTQTLDKYQLFEAFFQLFVGLSRLRPIVILVENLQWADFATRELLNYIARGISAERILLIGLRRVGGGETGDSLDEWAKSDGTVPRERIALANLSREESALLTEGLMGRDDLPASFLESLYGRTMGNPLFIEEMVKYLKRQGKIPIGRSLDQEDRSVPGSVMEMLRGQVNAIQEDKRSILAMAAVIGVEFSFDLLMLLSLKNEGYLLDVIDESVRQGIFKEVDHPTEDRYAFVNPLFQEVLYDGINKRRRRKLHKQIGDFLEKYYADRIEDLYGELAFHYQNSGNMLKALEYSVRAGDKAESLFANQEAILFYDRAIEIVGSARGEEADPTLYLELREKKADILDLIGKYDQAESTYEEIIGTTGENGLSKARRARILGKLGVVREKKGETDRAIQTLKEGMNLLDTPDGEERARLLSYLGDAYLKRGQVDKSIACCLEGLDVLGKTVETAVGAQTYMTVGCGYLEKGNGRKAKRFMERGIEIFQSTDDLKGLGRALLSMGTLYYVRGNYGKAREYYEASRELASKTGNVSLLLSCYNNLGMVTRVRGDLKSAVEHWENGLVLAEKIDHRRSVAYLMNNLGNASRELGEYSAALSRLTEGLGIFRKLRSEADVRRVNRGLAVLYLNLGDWRNAEKLIRSDDPSAAPGGVRSEKQMHLDVLGRVHREKKEYGKAEGLLLRSLEGFRKSGDPEDVAVSLLDLAELYLDWGIPEKMSPYLMEGQDLATKIRSKKLIALSDYLQGRLLLLENASSEAAVPTLKKACRRYASLSLPLEQMASLYALGLAFEKIGKIREAGREYRRAAEIVQSLKKKIIEIPLLKTFESLALVKGIESKAPRL